MALKRTITVIGGIACLMSMTGFGTDFRAEQQKSNVSLWPRTAPAPDALEGDRFIDQLMSHMSLDEKIGQMIQADIAFIVPEDLHRYRLGSILAGGNAAPNNDLRAAPGEWLKLTQAFHHAALTETSTHAAIPLLFGIDAVHGHAKVRGATIFPHNVGLGAAHDPDLIRRIGTATATEVAATGIDWTFAPTVAVVRDVRWGRSYESYSESPDLVAQYSAAMVTGLQGTLGSADYLGPGHTLASVKHFVGDGGTEAGRDQGDTVISEYQLSHVHAAGYPAAINAGALIVMASYNSWNGTKLHDNRYLLTDVLKDRMGFSGFVVGDWNAHEQIPGCTKTDCAAAIMAGVDMLMAPDGWRELYENLLRRARAGDIPATRINDAVRRILRVKMMAGLFKERAISSDSFAGRFDLLGSEAHRAIAREAVRKSLVMLKNDRHLLPLNPSTHVLVVGDAANEIGTQCGGWTVDWQGDSNSNADIPGATSIYAGINAVVSRAGGTATWSAQGDFLQRPDVAIVVFGEKPYAEFEGDRETLEYSPGDKIALGVLRKLRAAGVPTVAVFLSGRPLWVNPEINASQAFVAAWLPGSEAEGIADVFFRAPDGSIPFDFTGRLSFSWPATAMPVAFTTRGVQGAQFDNGYGLTYRSDSLLGTLPEKALVPPRFAAPEGSLFFAGHPTAPWSLFVEDDDAEIHVATSQQVSPHGAVHVRLAATGATATWSTDKVGSVQITGRASGFSALVHPDSQIAVQYRVEHSPDKRVFVGMRCTDARCGTTHGTMFDVSDALRTVTPGEWHTLTLPLSCVNGEKPLTTMDMPFVIRTAGQFAVTIRDVRVSTSKQGAHPVCPLPADAGP